MSLASYQTAPRHDDLKSDGDRGHLHAAHPLGQTRGSQARYRRRQSGNGDVLKLRAPDHLSVRAPSSAWTAVAGTFWTFSWMGGRVFRCPDAKLSTRSDGLKSGHQSLLRIPYSCCHM